MFFGASQLLSTFNVGLQIRGLNTSYTTNKALYQAVDNLPYSGEWQSQVITITGDLKSAMGVEMTEEVELWHRDPVECVRELLGNPVFDGKMRYAPEQLYEDEEGTQRVLNEMWTEKWWWDTQVSTQSRNLSLIDGLKTTKVQTTYRCYSGAYDPGLGQDQTLAIPGRPERMAGVPHNRQHFQGHSSTAQLTRNRTDWIPSCGKTRLLHP